MLFVYVFLVCVSRIQACCESKLELLLNLHYHCLLSCVMPINVPDSDIEELLRIENLCCLITSPP